MKENSSSNFDNSSEQTIEKAITEPVKSVPELNDIEKPVEEQTLTPGIAEKKAAETLTTEIIEPKQKENSTVGSLDLANLMSLKDFSKKVESELPVEDDILNLVQTNKNWEEYRSNKASVQLKVMMDQSELVFSEEELKIIVPSELAKSRVLEEKELLELLREGMGSSKYKMTFEVDLAKVDEEELAKNKVPVTSREKLEHFYDRNENFKEIVERLSLRIKD